MAKYLTRYRPSHPRASTTGCIYVHVDIAEKALGRFLPDGAEVHHVDGNPHNNEPRNLVICPDKAYHKLLHYRLKVLRAGGNPNTDKLCCDCQQVKPLDDFNLMRSNKSNGRQSLCRECGKVRGIAKRQKETEAA